MDWASVLFDGGGKYLVVGIVGVIIMVALAVAEWGARQPSGKW